MARTDLWHRMTFLLPVTEITTSLKHPYWRTVRMAWQ